MSKKILILGASSDIGIALIKKINLLESDAVIYAHYLLNCERICSIEVENNNKIIPIKADLSYTNGANDIIEEIMQNGDIPNVIVHLPASKLEFIKFKDIDWNNCVREINIQVGSIMKVLQFFLPKMSKVDVQNKIVFMLSENTIKEPAKYSTQYSMAKYMLLGLMKSLNQEYSKKNININALSPTMVNTKLLSKIDHRLLELNGITNKMLSVDDVAEKLIYLISGESDNLYGENLYLSNED